MSDKRFILGFESLGDLINSALASGKHLAGYLYGMFGAIITGVAGFVYDPKEAVYFLAILMLIDWATKVIVVTLKGTFVSYKLPRMSLNILVMLAVLGCFYNGARYFEPIAWLRLPTIVYGGFVVASLASILENLNQAGLIPADLYRIASKLLNYDSIVKLITRKATKLTGAEPEQTPEEAPKESDTEEHGN